MKRASRRELLGAVGSLVALSGCSGGQSGNVVTADAPAIDDGTPTASPTSTPTESPTATSTEPPGTATPAQTPVVAPVPPADTVSVRWTDVTLRDDDTYYYADTDVRLVNHGKKTFTKVELRVDVYYESRTTDRTHVASGYAVSNEPFSPDEKRTMSPPLRQMRFLPDGDLDDPPAESGFSAEVAFREVHYFPR